MSGENTKGVMQEGDVCFIWLGYKINPARVVLRKGDMFMNHLGSFPHEYFIGQNFGSKIFAMNVDGNGENKADKKNESKEKLRSEMSNRKRKRNRVPEARNRFVYALSFTPELWTKGLNHRTQILYDSDNSLIVSGLGLKPGDKVAESGTGSTSLSHAIVRAIAPTGMLNTFEFNEHRVHLATKDFEINLGKMSKCVKVFHRDAIAEGFMVGSVIYDSIFLDLPDPWNAIGNAYAVLKANGRLCSFSPCIEQTQRTNLMLQQFGFYNIETIECLQREVKSSEISCPTPNCLLEDTSHDKKIKYGKTVLTYSGTRAFGDIAGHTGFLTFSTKSPN